LVAFATVNSFRRNVRTGMSMQLLKEEYSKNNVRLRILTPVDKQIMQTIEELRKVISELDIRALNESTESNNRVTIVLADRKECLIVDIKDDKKDNVYEAVGLAIYSNVKSIVSSYLAIFETLWKQNQPLIR
jgi:two-component system, OmpR family, sensor histidine kinase VicK